jgi:Icc-related predicted phosphoesterase
MLHNNFDELPGADVIIHTGDFLAGGKQHELHDFAKWWKALPYDHKIIVPGNHDRCLAWKPEFAEKYFGYSNIHYLVDDSVTIDGITFYGSPWSPRITETEKEWSFIYDRNSDELEEKWAAIPSGINVLLTHCPPFGYRDAFRGIRRGCELLTIELMREDKIQPKYHIFGHIHTDYGEARFGSIKLFNAANEGSLLGDGHAPPTVFDYEVGIAL